MTETVTIPLSVLQEQMSNVFTQGHTQALCSVLAIIHLELWSLELQSDVGRISVDKPLAYASPTLNGPKDTTQQRLVLLDFAEVLANTIGPEADSTIEEIRSYKLWSLRGILT